MKYTDCMFQINTETSIRNETYIYMTTYPGALINSCFHACKMN